MTLPSQLWLLQCWLLQYWPSSEAWGHATDNNARPRLFQCIGRRLNTMGAGWCTGSDKGPESAPGTGPPVDRPPERPEGAGRPGRAPTVHTAPPPVGHPVQADRGDLRTAVVLLIRPG